RYNNRFGTLAQLDNAGNFITFRTNIGNSVTKGLELFVQADWPIRNKIILSAYTSTALMDARYRDAVVKSGNQNTDIDGNFVESSPKIITRNGISMRIYRLSFALLYSYTASSFADALNTKEAPPTTGAVGLVPAYGIVDLNASFRINTSLQLKVSVSNLTNKQYFTKRPLFYPGPGVWPSDGRNVSATAILRL
ncbi:MAG: TonB-dependent receptor, partial [Chitinophagaceae bacterium]|nr:TonB-dependent receptor [Chitinophagaceae bacterium]